MKYFKVICQSKILRILLDKNSGCGDICNLKEAVGKVEAKLISQAFDNAGNVRDAAKILGIDASTFVRKRKRYLEKDML